MNALSILVLLVAQQSKQEPFKYDPWAAWNSFAAGAGVEHEVETTSGKTTTIRTIESKTESVITIRVTRRMKVGDKEQETSELEQVKKPEAGAEEKDPPCSSCGKVHPRDTKQDKQKVKVRDVELDCVLLESTVVDCQGKKIGRLRRWYSKEVPGWVAKMESIVDETRTTTACTAFVKK